MEKIKHEIARTDPDVPFRASSSHIHHTWAKTFQSRPELYIRPQSLEEVQKVVNLARRCRRRIVVVGSGHSPNDLTCTSSWMINLDDYGKLLHVDRQKKTFLVEAGMRLHDLNHTAHQHGLSMPNLGSIDAQSIAGAIATATHGSSLKHGIISESVLSLRVVLSNGHAVRCSNDQNQDLFKAALVSLGALGIVTEVEFQMVENYKVEWEQKLVPLDDVLTRWNTNLWLKEFTRVWWMPYMKRAIVWSAERTEKPVRAPDATWYGGSVGFHTYHNLLWLSNYIPWILPTVEWFVFGMQYGFSPGVSATAVQDLSDALLMNCLYSQFVNEWALPLHKGPEAITRLSAWLNGEPGGGGIPFSSKGLYVHCPIEVRVSDSTAKGTTRPFLDNTCSDGPTLYLNATLYRAYLQDPPCKDRYYEAFEWLMHELGAKPHYAKNFSYTTAEQMQHILGDNLKKWAKVRNEADPEGMFLGAWHRRTLGVSLAAKGALEEREVSRTKAADGGQFWVGELDSTRSEALSFATAAAPERGAQVNGGSPTPSSSAESFDMMHGAEAEKSTLFDRSDDEEVDRPRYHGRPQDTVTGTAVFDKM
ncbi:D-arabinono-1,4-lactone oxidase-domain-containing protein [Neohortaea acidophila]|uniref:D-arabinono-1,4-lactone oxidase n=1 Tax=Neohortaea acidophila TaxID=245834 RepID=A0A6A6PLF9_9PEZI|nr:D-arabinono-1,4-lactone oxidase-domain-containing protein [Neohortaea acidophila]KAF2480918.1 D-arabinono-1,4-lactone oxidase-domain-containing protein [Neohortaea acidophila]